MFTHRSVATVVILSIVTCGIYLLYWYWVSMTELYNAGGKSIGDLQPIVQFVLLFLYVGGIFFAVNAADNLNEVAMRNGMPANDNNKVLWLVLELVCPLIAVALIQNEMNKF